jgi:hypothetical protein
MHIRDVDEEMHPDIQRLLLEIERGTRVVQPRLRHRFQVDRHGLAYSRHRMMGNGDSVEFEFESNGSALQQVLGAVYALERLDDVLRRPLVALMRKPMGPEFIAYLAGNNSSNVSALADPRAWALEVLGFPAGTIKPSKREIMSRYRDGVRRAHPDHGGAEAKASKALQDISEARRVLLEMM